MGGANVFTRLSENVLTNKGQNSFRASNNQGGSRLIYPAIVRSIDDNASFNRIKAEIVDIDNNYNIIPGKDKDTPKDRLPICIPFLTEILHARPQVGECVFVIAENPTDLKSVRFWFGPVITSQIKLSYESYQEALPILNSGSFDTDAIHTGPTLQKQTIQASVFPTQTEVAVQGRNDADVVFRPREIEIRVGKFKLNSVTELNKDVPCKIILKQIDNNPNLTGIKSADNTISQNFVPYSQQNIMATNINFISNEGKFRQFDSSNPENQSNPRLKDFGILASQLHPAVFGDELIILLRLILQYLFNHIHTPQNVPLSNNISNQLQPYLSGKMQDLLSNVMRLC